MHEKFEVREPDPRCFLAPIRGCALACGGPAGYNGELSWHTGIDMDNQDLVRELHEMSARQIVRWLTTPARCGFYLSAEDLARLGRELGVSVSPFNRARALEQLLRGAALDGRLDDALGALRVEMERQLDGYRALDEPALSDWIERAGLTVSAWSAVEQAFADDSAEGG